jgi:hypothetical protein
MRGGRVLTIPQVRAHRTRSQRLDSPRRAGTVDDVVADVFAVQAQDDLAATLGIWARGVGLTVADVDRARNDQRSIVRVWSLRGTLHLVAAEDVRWLLELLRPTFARANRARRAELGLDENLTERGVRAVVEMLVNGPQTRSTISEGLAERRIPWQGQATIHVLWRAALDGLVCYGAPLGGKDTFVLLEDWVPRVSKPGATGPGADRDDMLVELARRFLHAYAPARPDDLAVWSGLSLADARRGWGQLGRAARQVDTERGPMWLPAERTSEKDKTTGVRLLPAFDGWWLGYRDRDLLLPAARRQHIYAGGGLIRPSVLSGAQPIGTWTRKTTRQSIDVLIDPCEPLSETVRGRIRVEVEDLGRFLGRPSRLVQ